MADRMAWMLCLLVFGKMVSAQEETKPKTEWLLHGYIKNMPSVSSGNSIDSVDFLYLFHNRMNLAARFPGNFTARLEVRNRFFYGSQVRHSPGLAESLAMDGGIVDLSAVPIKNESFVWHSNIDRLNLNWHNERWDITAGRQRINWGINTVWNPNDIFNAFNYLDFDYEERPGSDGIRVQYVLKEMSTLQAAWKVGRNGKDQVGALLYKFNRKGYDWQLLSGITENDYVLGLGWAGSIHDAGFKGEASYFYPRNNFGDTTGILSFSTGIDYTFSNGWYLNGAYLLNTGGNNSITGGSSEIFLTPSAKSLLPFRHTFFTQASKIITPLFTGNLSLIYAPGGSNTVVVFPSFTYSLANNWDLSFFGISVLGNISHYQLLGNNFFLRAKWSF